MLKKTLVYALTAAMTLSFAAPAAYGSQESVPAQSESAQAKLTLAESETSADAQKDASGITTEGVWDTDIRLSIRRENEIRNEAGMHLREWDDAVASKKQEGKDAPLTEDAVLEANPDATKKDINWEDLLYEEKQLVGPRSLKNMIFPWKY